MILKKFKRLLAATLAASMIVGLVPASAMPVRAAETEAKQAVDYAVVFSDLHTTKSDNKASTLKAVLKSMKDDGKAATTVNSSGNMFSVNETNYDCNTSAITSAIKEVYDSADINYVWTDHDRTSDIGKESGLVYGTSENEEYYVYLLSMADLSSWDRYGAGFYSASEITKHIEAFKETAAGLDKTKPLLIVGHQPLFNDRGDNGYAYQWVTAINEVAADMDVVYFNGHNHNYDEASNYYYAKGTTVAVPTTKVLSGSGYSTKLETKDVEFKFTHINAGYLSPATGTTSNTRMGTALAVTIYEDSINYTTYNSSGEYTGKFAVNETVERDHEAVKNEEKTVKFDDDILTIEAAALGLTAIDAENMTGEYDFDEYFTDHIAYNVELSGHKDENEIDYSILFLDDMDDTIVELYHVDEAGNKTEIPYEMNTDEYGRRYLEFTTTYTGTFVYGVPNVPVGYELSKIEVSNIVKDTYFVGESLDMVNPEVTAVYTKEGNNDVVRKLFIQGENVTDGYTVSGFDMTQAGKQTVVITYKDKTTSFEIAVKEKGVTDASTGVRVGDVDNNITGLVVTKKEETVEGYSAYVVYDIVPDGYIQGTEAEVTIPVDAEKFNAERPVQIIDVELGKVQNSSIENGKVIFTTTHFSKYAVAQRAVGAPATTEGLVATAVSNTSTTTVENNAYYLIKNNRNNLFLTGDKVTNAEMLVLGGTANKPALAANNIWYFSNVSGNNYNVRYKNANGQYLTIGKGTAELTDTTTNVTAVYDNGAGRKCFDIAVGDYHLNNYNGGTGAAGYTTGTSDAGSRWSLYKVTTVPATLSVNESALGMYIGDAQNLTATVTVNNAASTGSTITWESSNEDVVTVTDAGQVKAVGAGTAEITAILASVDTGRLLAPARVTIPVQVNTLIEGTTIEITHKSTQQIVDKTLIVKNVEENSEYELDYKVFVDGIAPETKPTENIVWSSSDESIATVENGVVTFHGNEGIVRITVSYEYEENTHATDSVVISVSKDNYMIPSDGTNDFPEYPNEGSVRFDKTATAVGNFSETGIAQLELSMTGVPFTSNNVLDVVLMLDHSNSMTEARMDATREATKLFIKNIVTNEDGTFNNNRIFVGSFQGGNPEYAGQSRHEFKINEITTSEDRGYQIVSNQGELDALCEKIEEIYYKYASNSAPYGTEYAQSLQRCYEILRDTKDDGHKQACVFMSDGIPNVYQYGAGANDRTTSSSAMAQMFTGNNYDTRDTDYKYEYYSSLMKQNGVTVYSVGLGLHGTNSSLSGASAEQCEHVSNILLNDISGPAGETEADRDTGTAVSKLNEYFYSVADSNAATGMADVFESISRKILEAAKNVKVTDKIADEYTMIFDVPEGPERDFVASKLPANQEFYIEFVNYTLKPVVEQGVTTDYLRDKETSLMKLYLGKKDGNYFAASDATGTPFAAPTFAAVQEGQDGYYNLVDGTYVFTANGTGTHNMISGARVSGTTNDDLVIETPYVHYEAANRILVWTADKLSSSELALRYFLYLNDSAAEDPDEQVDAGTYPTNDYATLEYTNFQGNDCQQIFPKPQMTWNGAQVSYVFYLVNEDGKPVNRAGRVVPFSEAVYVTDIFTYAVTWNRNDASAQLVEEYLAVDKVPDVYELYDKHAGYNIYVYETENGRDKNNHFDIIGSSKEANTTYVFNTKSDVDKYRIPGTYDKDDVHTGFDFSNTTVAFAVLWKPELAEDTVVIDYGLPVDIDVARNDAVAGAVTGIFDANNAAVLKDVKINEGQISNRVMFATELNPGGVNGLKYGKAEVLNNTTVRYTPANMQMETADKFYYVSTLNYYEKDKNGNDVLVDSRMYSSVTVIPATTIYYEDSFVSYEHGYGATDESDVGTPGKWEIAGTVNKSATQDEDRPGASQISADLDADNIYGYDSAYTNCDTYSLGSAHKVNLNKKTSGNWPKATFTFTGTGFDVISQTSNTTGTIAVTVSKDGQTLHNWIVDTYYGYTSVKDGFKKNTFVFGDDGQWHLTNSEIVETAGTDGMKPSQPKAGDSFVAYEENIEWVATDGENTLYQIPVIKSPELAYGTYTVTITPRFSAGFNHTANDNYDFYLDAIRVYSPADDGVVENADETLDTTVNDAYKADGELYPEFIELRKELLDQNAFAISESGKEGAVFIDGFGKSGNISDYSKYGPNNEIYLQKGQAVAFVLETDNASLVNQEHLGIKTPNGGDAAVTVSALAAGGTVKASKQVATSSATEQYYDVSECVNWNSAGTSDIIVIENKGDTMVSLTNLKVTYNVSDAAPALMMMDGDAAATAVRFMSARYVDSVDTAEKAKVLSVTTDKSSYTVRDVIKATVKTNEAAEYIRVNGEKITDYITDGNSRIWTYTEKTSKIGNVKLTVTAYNELDEKSDDVTKTISVKKFAPKTFKLELNKSKVAAGEKVTAKVTTSNTVKYVTVNGKKVTKYTTNKAKTLKYWTIEVEATKVGTVTVKAVAYNKDDAASASISKSFKATNFAPKTYKVTVDKKTVKKGAKYTVKVTASNTVKYVTVNGQKITKFKYNKKKTLKTFTVTYTAKTTGKKNVKVVAYNKNDSASKTKTVKVTVKRK